MQDHNHSTPPSAMEAPASESSAETAPAPGLSAWQALLALRDAVVAASTGLGKLELKYSGSHDEGTTEELSCEPEGIADLFVEALTFDLRWHPTDRFRCIPTPARRSVGDVFEEMANLAISISGHDGYEDGDGGFGSLQLDLSTGELTLEHHDCHVASTRSFHDLSEVVLDEPEATEFDEDGIPVRKVSFGGCGGHSDDC